jgi:DNA modification methylase
MEPVIVVGGARVFHGDCREVLKTLPDNSIDSIVTDPPYELGFMGKKWDSSGIAYDVTVWQECLRVVKPGGHLLAFGGSRTWHRLAVAVEDAGFELRDSIAWIYGSGFPKSLDVSKAIDKTNGEGGRRYKFTAWMRTTGLTSADIDRITGTNMGGHYLTAKSQPAIPTVALWEMLRPHCRDVPAWVDELVARVEAEREVIGQKAWSNSANHFVPGENHKARVNLDETAPATSEAKTWEGWGTALKPAHEPIVVGRKPLVGTVAENVLAWGVGGLNIDGSRIGTTGGGGNCAGGENCKCSTDGRSYSPTKHPVRVDVVQGRWPANVIFDEVTAGLLDEQSGVSAYTKQTLVGSFSFQPGQGADALDKKVIHGEKEQPGGASRFFYVAKASKRDRNEGLEELEAVSAGDMVERVEGSAGMDSPRAGAGRTSGAKNFHPTVKPTQLMRYLIKLVTPPGGTVLDPFMGSGSTGKAALLDGFGFVGVELTEEYLPIIEGRLRWANEQGVDDERLF